jgi:hypothetical protein
MGDLAGKPIRLLVCGSREWWDRDLLRQVLSNGWWNQLIRVLVEGEARGADNMAREWAFDNGIEVEPYPADWDRYGKPAGPIRNQQMLDEGEPTLVVAFHDDLYNSKGTRDMVKRAQRAGIQVEVYSHTMKEGFVPHGLI